MVVNGTDRVSRTLASHNVFNYLIFMTKYAIEKFRL